MNASGSSFRTFSKVLLPIPLFLVATLAFGHEPEPQLPFARLHAHEEIEIHAHAGWDSRYLSEGRDALNGDSLLSGSFELGWEHLTAGIWYGNSPDQRYDELQMALAVVQELGDFEFYAGYTHFRFPFENAHDNEVGAGLTWSDLPLDLKLTVDAYYSFEADGYFTEIGCEREFPVTDKLSLILSGQFGMNQGYVVDGHDGANHFAARLGLQYAVTDSVSIVAHGTHSWGLNSEPEAPGDDQLKDFFLGGIGLEWAF